MDMEYMLRLPPHGLEMTMFNLTELELSQKLIDECVLTMLYNGVAFDNDITEDSTSADQSELAILFAEADKELEA